MYNAGADPPQTRGKAEAEERVRANESPSSCRGIGDETICKRRGDMAALATLVARKLHKCPCYAEAKAPLSGAYRWEDAMIHEVPEAHT